MATYESTKLIAVCGTGEDGVERIATRVENCWIGRQREAYSPDSARQIFAKRSDAVLWVNEVHDEGCGCPASQFAGEVTR